MYHAPTHLDTAGIYAKYLFYFSYSENKSNVPNKAQIHLEYFPDIVGEGLQITRSGSLAFESRFTKLFHPQIHTLCYSCLLGEAREWEGLGKEREREGKGGMHGGV